MSKVLVARGQRIALAVAGVSLLPSVNAALAADGTWAFDGAGNWSDVLSVPSRWVGNIPADGVDAIANFTNDITANRTITVDGAVASRTVGTINFNDAVAEGTPTATFKQYTIAASGGGTLTLATSTGTPTLNAPTTVSHTLNLPVITSQGLTKIGDGTVILAAANPNLVGPLVVNQGTLRANNAGSFNGQAITIANGALAYHAPNNGIFSSNYTIAGEGPTEAELITRLGAIRFAGQSQTISGSITLTGDAGISARSSVSATPATISGQITGGFALRLGRTSTTTSAGNGFLVLSNPANNWGGNTTIEDGTVRLGASNVIPHGGAAGNVIMQNDGTRGPITAPITLADSVLDLNGNNERINGLSHAAGSDVSKIRVINGGGVAAMLTLGDNNAAGNFGGALQNGAAALGLTKVGNAIQNLSGNNTYTGDTFVQEGTLSLTSATSNNNIGSSARMIVGDTPANSGAKLDVTGISTAGGFQVPSGQTLMGHGTVIGGATVNAGAIINPGNGIGTLTRQGNTVLAGVLKIDSNGTSIDLLDNSGSALDITAGTLDLDLSAALTDPAYILAKYGSLIGGNFASVLDLPAGYSVDYNYLGGNQIALVTAPVPEPGGLMLLGAGCLALAARRRRK